MDLKSPAKKLMALPSHPMLNPLKREEMGQNGTETENVAFYRKTSPARAPALSHLTLTGVPNYNRGQRFFVARTCSPRHPSCQTRLLIVPAFYVAKIAMPPRLISFA